MDFHHKPKRGRPSNWDRALRQSYEHSPNNTTQLLRRIKANDRERNRMQNINYMLKLLKNMLPIELDENDEKLTKIETLRLATEYIEQLTQMLNNSSFKEYTLEYRNSSNSSYDSGLYFY